MKKAYRKFYLDKLSKVPDCSTLESKREWKQNAWLLCSYHHHNSSIFEWLCLDVVHPTYDGTANHTEKIKNKPMARPDPLFFLFGFMSSKLICLVTCVIICITLLVNLHIICLILLPHILFL